MNAVTASQAEKLTLPGPAGALEALLERPADAHPGLLAVVCHPHPLHGGTMLNKVVHMLARSAQDLGVTTLRFNFRGTGQSAGQYDNGRGETEDALAVAEWGRRELGLSRLWALGFSFGSFVAFQLASRAAAERLVMVAPPVQRFDFATLALPPCPWLVVQGDADELVNHESVLEWTRSLAPPPEVRLLAGVDHFFHGRLTELRGAVRGWLYGPGART